MIPNSEHIMQPGSHRPCLTLAFECVFNVFRSWFGLPSTLEVSTLVAHMQARQYADLDFLYRPELAIHAGETKRTARNGNVRGTRAAQHALNLGPRKRWISGVLPIFSVDYIHYDYRNVQAPVQKSYPANLS